MRKARETITIMPRRQLDAGQTNELVRRAQAGDVSARNELVEANMPLVMSTASQLLGKRMFGASQEFEDLVQEGTLGLIEAVARHDVSRGDFGMCALLWVKNALGQACRNRSRAVRVPGHVWSTRAAIQRLRSESPDVGNDPEAIAARIGCPATWVTLALKAFRPTSHGDEPLDRRHHLGLPSDDGPEAALLREEDRREVREAIDELDDRSRTVLRLRLGLDGEGPMTCLQIGDRIGLNRETIRLTEKRAHVALRERLVAIA